MKHKAYFSFYNDNPYDFKETLIEYYYSANRN